MNELLERDSESADPQQGQTPFCKSETKFVGTPHDLDPLQNVIVFHENHNMLTDKQTNKPHRKHNFLGGRN